MTFNRRYRNRGRNANGNPHGERKTINQNLGGRRNFCRRSEFKFQLHDPLRKGTYTFERIHEASC